ncbi:MAG: tetratricopeptide repeat protein [Anaerolineae bacterium]|nr:tetratricopeptide repeat protein [Anaerolineae bacterium]
MNQVARRTALLLCMIGVGGVLLSALAACSAEPATPAPSTVTRTPSPTRKPTATRTPTPTRTPRPTSGPGLDELMETPLAMAAAADLEGAQAAYSDLASLYPGSVEPLLGLSALLQRQGDWEAALDYLERAAEVDPSSWEALRQWALLLEQQGDYIGLAGVYDRMVRLEPEDPDLLVARATIKARLGQADAAVDDLQAAQALDPHREYAWINVTGAASGARQYEAAIEIAGAGLEAHPDAAGLLMERGLAYLSLGDAERAMADFAAVIDHDDSHYSAYHWRGRTLIALERYDEASEDLQKAGELGVLSGAAGVNQAYESMAYAADAMARSDVNAAFTYLAQQVFEYGSRDALLLGYGLVRWRQGSVSLALDYMDSRIEAGYIPALYWRGMIYADDGQEIKAVADLQAFLAVRRFGPDVESARELLEEIGVDPDDL